MHGYKELLHELNTRKQREENILLSGKGVKSFDIYQNSLGRLQNAKEFIELIEEYRKNDRI